MRKLIFFLLIAHSSFATNYYVSNAGNDANTGTSAAFPWQTLSKVNSFPFNPGDQVNFNRGDIWFGTIIITRAGTLGNPIIYSNYGSGTNPLPIITGMTNLTSWTNLGGNIWETTSSVSSLSNCNIVTVNGVNTPVGRWPNTSYLPYQSNNSGTSITSSSLTGTPNWTGAFIVMKRARWWIEADTITSQSGGTPVFTNTPGYYNLQPNWGFFIQNDPRTLDTLNEWYYNPSTGKLRIYSIGTPSGVSMATSQRCIDNTANKPYITIDGLNLKGANLNVVDGSLSTYFTVTNCDISLGGSIGVYYNGNNNTITHNTVTDMGYTGIGADEYTSNGVFSYNTIRRVSLFPAVPKRSGGSAMYIRDSKAIVEHNRVDSSGWGGILLYGDSSVAQYNYVTNSCLTRDDGAGLATHGGFVGMKFLNNLVLSTQGNSEGFFDGGQNYKAGNGIYLDDLTNYLAAQGNTSANNNGLGLFFHRATNITATNNTLYNNGNNIANYVRGQVMMQYTDSPKVSNIIFKNNIVYSANSNQQLFRFATSPPNTNFPSSMGTLDSNIYVNGSGMSTQFFSGNNGTTGDIAYSLSGWRTLTGQESHSVDSTSAIIDNSKTILVYNPTMSDSTVTLTSNYKDWKGNMYKGSIILHPFTSAILIYISPLIPQSINVIFSNVNKIFISKN